MPTRRLRYILFFVGLVIALFMAMRSQVHRDHFFLLALGWELVENGRIPPFGPHISGGGLYPGYLSGLLTGLPMLIWEDYRAANFLVLLLRVAAYVGLDRALRNTLDERERLLLCVLYWLSPWSLYYSAFLWAPNWVFLFGVVHMWTAFRQRHSARFIDSFLHVLVIGAVFQFHGSFVILAASSALLYLRGYFKVNWGGVAAAMVALAASMTPWMLMAVQNPLLRPVGEGYLGRGLVVVYPILRGVLYWFRYPSMMFRYTTLEFDFTPALGAQVDAVLTPALIAFTWVVGPVSVLLCLWAFIWYWKQRPPNVFSKISVDATSRQWLVGFVRWTFLGSVVTFALSPTTIMSWQVFVIMHVTVLPTALWLADLWRRGDPKWIGKAVGVHIVVLALLSIAMSLASPMFRQGGRRPVALVVKENYPFLLKLGVDRHCVVVVDPELGYSTDPDEHAARVD